jgi:hypothetical protein
MSLSGHLTRSIFDRYHIVSESDLSEAVAKLGTFHQITAGEVRKVVALGANTDKTRTVSGRTLRVPRQTVASLTGFEPCHGPPRSHAVGWNESESAGHRGGAEPGGVGRPPAESAGEESSVKA